MAGSFAIWQSKTILGAILKRGKRFVARAEEKFTAFLELERAICLHLLSEQIYRMKIVRRGTPHSHFYQCSKWGKPIL
jgi:hypothetical protein